MKIRTFIKTMFSGLIFAMTGVNIYQSYITSTINPFWGVLCFIGSEIIVIIASVIGYYSIKAKHNLDWNEEL